MVMAFYCAVGTAQPGQGRNAKVSGQSGEGVVCPSERATQRWHRDWDPGPSGLEGCIECESVSELVGGSLFTSPSDLSHRDGLEEPDPR